MSYKIFWQELFTKSAPPYTEYGKVFNFNGATELKTLNSSDPQIEKYAADFYLKEYSFHKISSPFMTGENIKDFGKISVALKEINELQIDGYLYAQVQQRREGEFSNNSTPRLDRYFIQARFTYLSRDVMWEIYKRRLGLYKSILYNRQSAIEKANNHMWMLNDYVVSVKNDIQEWKVGLAPLELDNTNIDLVVSIVRALLYSSTRAPEEGTQFARTPSSIVIVKHGLTIEEKLQIVDAVQYFVFPVLGVITFSLDYITEKKVLLRFYDSFDKNEHKYNEEDLKGISIEGNLSDYCDVVFQLDPNTLYDNEFQRLLKAGNTTLQAVNKLALKSKKIIISEFDAWIEKVNSAFGDIDISPVDADFICDELTDDDILQIIRNHKTPFNIVLALLEYEERKTKSNLLAYLQFHLSIPKGKRQHPLFGDQVVQLFQRAVESNPPAILDQNLQDLSETIIKELILYARDVNFSSDHDTGPKVLISLLQRPNQKLFDVLKTVAFTDPELLIDSIVDQANSIPLDWNTEQIYSFWELFDLHVFELFILLLSMLVTSTKNREIVINNPKKFWNFLKSGRGILVDSSKFRFKTISVDYDQYQALEVSDLALLPKLEADIGKKLRDVCLKIATSNKIDNIRFAEWWFFAELGYTEFGIIQEDFLQLQWAYVSAEINIKKAVLFEYGNLVSFGKMGLVSSLQSVCKNCEGDAENMLNSINLRLFNAISEIWVDKGILLSSDDLALLIHQLPQTNKLLAKIALSEIQRPSVIALDATNALIWLTGTYGILRQEYRRSEEDFLCKHLMELERPDSVLAWRILVEEESAFQSNIHWSNYVDICLLWEARIQEHEFSLSENLKTYFELVEKTPGPQQVGLVNRTLIKQFVAKIFYGEIPDISSFSDSEIEGLYLYWSNDSESKKLKRIADIAGEFLIYYLNSSEFFDSWGNLQPKTISLLQKFVFSEYSYVSQEALKMIGEREQDAKIDKAQPAQASFEQVDKRESTGGESNIITTNKHNVKKKKPLELLVKIFKVTGFIISTFLAFISLIVIILVVLKFLGLFDFISLFYTI